jgi:Xaa-Pro aminopeptidase
MKDPTYLARHVGGWTVKDWEKGIDVERMRRYRLERLQAEVRRRDLAGIILFGGVNVRYATGTRFAQIFNLHSPFRCAWVPAEGKVTMFDWERLHEGDRMPDIIGEAHDSIVFTYFPAGDRAGELADQWADEMVRLIKRDAGDNCHVAIDICEPIALLALMKRGVEITSGEEVVERACAVKSPDEITLILQTITIAEAGLARVRTNLRPGITEIELWAELHHENIRNGGEWVEYRLAGSGGRTNPWGQECSDRMIRAGELFAIDTGMIGPWGYGADMSRTFHCKPGRPTDEQRRLYRTAWENLEYNRPLIKAGVSFRALSEMQFKLPDEFWDQRYSMPFHGMGMGDEWPSIPYWKDWEKVGYDGILEVGMVLTVESYIGAVGGTEGVKLEDMVLVTEDCYQLLTTFPFEDELLT